MGAELRFKARCGLLFFLIGVQMLAAAPADADPTTVTVDAAVSVDIGVPFRLDFDELPGAKALLSFSAGSLTTSDGGFYALSVVFADNSSFVLLDEAFASQNESIALTSFTALDFPTFGPATAVGLLFEADTSLGTPDPGGVVLDLPIGTEIVFHVPEPEALPLGALAALGILRGGRGLRGRARNERRCASPRSR